MLVCSVLVREIYSEERIQLVDSERENMGNIAVNIYGTSYRVCDNSWNNAGASVVCRMFGYRLGGIATTGSLFGTGNNEVVMHEVKCSGTEDRLDDCPMVFGKGRSNCDNTMFAGVICTTFKLTGSQAKHQGHIEMNILENVYRVCGDSWGDAEANVVCRLLGYSLGGIATTYFGIPVEDSIILADVTCSGSEKSLTECAMIMGPEQHNCNEGKIAGVTCALPLQLPEPCGQRKYGNARVSRSPKAGGINLRGPAKRSKLTRKKRIVSGHPAPHGKYPWHVRLSHRIRSIQNDQQAIRDSSVIFVAPYWSYRISCLKVQLAPLAQVCGLSRVNWFSRHCGGTVITQDWIITAAHCFEDSQSPSSYNLTVGESNFEKRDSEEQNFAVDKLILHESYDTKSLKGHDIALVKVKHKNGQGIVFNDYVQPACLPTASTKYPEELMCELPGWGSISHSKLVSPDVLQWISLPLVNRTSCQQHLDSLGIKTKVTDHEICAGYLHRKSGFSGGDSGGGLVCELKEGAYTLMGIGSKYVDPGHYGGSPGVYVMVSKFLPWIRKKVQEDSDALLKPT